MGSGSNKSTVIKDPRMLAVKILMEVSEQGLLVPQASAKLPFDLSGKDRQFCFEMVYGTLRYLPGLERTLRQFCPKPKYPSAIHWLLLMSLYQMGFMRVPNYALVNEAIRVAKALRMGGLRGLINGVLRNAARKGEALWPQEASAEWLLPEWMGRRFVEQYGRDEVQCWLEQWNERPLTSYWSVKDQPLTGDEPSPVVKHAFRHNGPFQADDFLENDCYVQNEASQLIGQLALELQPDSVLDLCAAPGGKACYLAAFGKQTRLVACDNSEQRLQTLKSNQARLDLSFETRVQDSASVEGDERFDLVLVDAPCSGIGIIGRHPELKIHKKKPAPAHLRALQKQLLWQGLTWVKPGGHLLFTVCSLDKQEVPTLPEHAQFCSSALEQWLPKTITQLDKDRFYTKPSTWFDGFQGTLLQKKP